MCPDVRVIPCVQGGAVWHRLRQRRYTATDIGKLVGASPYGRPADVWLSKLGKSTRRDSGALFLRVGHLLESLAREEWIRATGLASIGSRPSSVHESSDADR